MNNKILEEIDKLKLMCMLDMATPPEKTDLERYEEWIEEIQGRKCSHYPFEHCNWCDPTEWANYSTLRCVVEDLFYKRHGKNKKYHEYRDEIRKITAEVIAMTLFIQKENNL